MKRHKAVSESDLFAIASYLARPEVDAEIHAEVPDKQRAAFEKEYLEKTGNNPLPTSGKAPYYVWPPNANKYGKELRIYFNRVPPEPPCIRDLCADYGKWWKKADKWRINHADLVMRLLECGFLLGDNSGRINRVMKERFPAPEKPTP